MIVPSIAVERVLKPGLHAELRIRDYLDAGELAEDNIVQNFAFTLGLSFSL